MTEIEQWIDLHDAELREVAGRRHTDADVVRLLAMFVLSGLEDEEIYEQLREVLPSPDGQRNPLAGAPAVLDDLRDLVAAS